MNSPVLLPDFRLPLRRRVLLRLSVLAETDDELLFLNVPPSLKSVL